MLKSIISALVFALFASSALAQSGSIVGTPAVLTPSGRPMTMREASLTFQAPPRQHTFQRDDLITVRVRQNTSFSNIADNQRRRQVESGAGLTAWTKFAGLFKMPLAATGALPEVGGSLQHREQNRGRLTRAQTVEFDIQARVSDVRDNGNLVIEGNSTSLFGEEGNIITLRGIVSPQNIGPDRTIESRHVHDLVIEEVPSGNVFDTIRRPWGQRIFEQFRPF